MKCCMRACFNPVLAPAAIKEIKAYFKLNKAKSFITLISPTISLNDFNLAAFSSVYIL